MKTLSIHTDIDKLPAIVSRLPTWKELAVNDALLMKDNGADTQFISAKRRNMELWWLGKEGVATYWTDAYTLADALRDVLKWSQNQNREFVLESKGDHFFNELVWCENGKDPCFGLNRYMACRLVHTLWQHAFHFMEGTRRFFFKLSRDGKKWYFLMTDKDTLPTDAYVKEGWCPVDQEYLNKGGA